MQVAQIVDAFSRYGVIFMLFMVGLQTSISEMRDVGGDSIRVALIGVIALAVLVPRLLLAQPADAESRQLHLQELDKRTVEIDYTSQFTPLNDILSQLGGGDGDDDLLYQRRRAPAAPAGDAKAGGHHSGLAKTLGCILRQNHE